MDEEGSIITAMSGIEFSQTCHCFWVEQIIIWFSVNLIEIKVNGALGLVVTLGINSFGQVCFVKASRAVGVWVSVTVLSKFGFVFNMAVNFSV